MPDDKLPPIVQEITADASKAINEQDKFKKSTAEMASTVDSDTDKAGKSYEKMASRAGHAAEETESHNHRAGLSFMSLVGGLGLANLASDAMEKGVEGLSKVMEVGIDRAKEDSALNAQLAAGIQSTGGAAGTTVEGMNKLSESIAQMSGQTSDSISKTESLLLTFTNIKNVGPDKVFDQATLAAANMAARFGGDATQSAIQLGKALNDPVKGVASLSRVGVQFTDAQKKQIKAMEAAGNTMGAQKLILAELNKEFGNCAKAAGETLPGAINRAKESFAEMSGKVVSAFIPAITPIFNTLVNLFQGMSPTIEKFAEFLSGMLSKVGPMFAPLMAGVSGFGKVISPILNDIMKGWGQLAPVVAGLVPPIVKVASSLSPMMLILKAIEPVLPTLIGAVVSLAKSLGEALTSALQVITPILLQVGQILSGVIGQVIQALVPVVASLAQSLGGLLVTAVQAIAPLLTMLGKFLGEILQAIVPLIAPVLSLVQAFVPLLVPIMQLVGSLLAPLIQLLQMLLTPILALVQGFVQFLVPALQTVVMWFTQYITPIIRNAQVVFQGLSDFIGGVFTGNWSRAWQGVQNIFSGVWDGIKNIAAGALNGVIDLINGVIGGIDQLTGALSKATGGHINLTIPKIPHVSFAIGTDMVPGSNGAPLDATIHGGEAVVSNAQMQGSEPLGPRVLAAAAQPINQGTGGSGGTVINQYVDVTQSNPSADDIAQALAFHFAIRKG